MKENYQKISNSIIVHREYVRPTIDPEARKRIKDKILQMSDKVVYNCKEEK